WASDPRFVRNTARVQHRSVLIPAMEAVTRTRSTADWIALLQDKAVPCGPINDMRQAFEDPQVQARGLRIDMPRAAGDGIAHIAGVASPLRLSDHPAVLRHAPPALGEHTVQVLQELGLSAERIAELQQARIV
ncbi:MAG TPA: CoA transferase, partial [Pseudorhodoferax sp.]|nr:CoA transferase [Pseudorhodoferax sp.]